MARRSIDEYQLFGQKVQSSSTKNLILTICSKFINPNQNTFEKGNKFYRALNNFEALQNAPNVFLCFTVGRAAVFLESLHEDCLIEVIHEIFSKTFPKLNLPKPSRVLQYVINCRL